PASWVAVRAFQHRASSSTQGPASRPSSATVTPSGYVVTVIRSIARGENARSMADGTFRVVSSVRSCAQARTPLSDAGLGLIRGVGRALEPFDVADAGVASPLRPRVAAVLPELSAVLLVCSVCERSLARGQYGGTRQGAE